MKPRYLIAAALIVVLSNLAAWLGVSYNRSGESLETVILTEKELEIAPSDQDDSSVTLRLNWRTRPTNSTTATVPERSVIDRTKLQQLGFELPEPTEDTQERFRPIPRLVFVVLERFQASFSIVDAGQNFEDLRSRYADRGKFLIVQGVVRPVLRNEKGTDGTPGGKLDWEGFVVQVIPFMIHVPRPYSESLAPFKSKNGSAVHYRVTLCFGKSMEPWVTAVEVLGRKDETLTR